MIYLYLSQEGPDKISVCDQRLRTTSALESYNGRLGAMITGGSNFFKFAKFLIREEAVKLKEFQTLLRSGGASKITVKQTDRQKAILEGTQMLLQNVCTVEDFLSRVSFSAGTKDLCDDFDIADVEKSELMTGDETLAVPSTSQNNRGGNNEIGVPSTSQNARSRSNRGRGRNNRNVPRENSVVPSRQNSFDDFEVPNPPNVPIQIVLPSSSISPENADRNNDSGLCISCCEIRSVAFNCMHMVYCSECYQRHNEVALEAYQLQLNSMSRRRGAVEPELMILCPICKQQITSATRIIL